MKHKLHAAAAVLAFLLIAAFWSSTLVSELFLSPANVVSVKRGIVFALAGFVPLMLLTAGSGFSLGGQGRHPLLLAKRRRMPFIAANGLLILVPAALFLSARAQAGQFDTVFYTVQAVELIAGALNLLLIGRNIRDGMRLHGRFA